MNRVIQLVHLEPQDDADDQRQVGIQIPEGGSKGAFVQSIFILPPCAALSSGLQTPEAGVNRRQWDPNGSKTV